MADTKISALTAATSASAGDQLVLVVPGATKRITFADLLNSGLTLAGGAVTAETPLRFGASATEGMEWKSLDETIDLTDAGAKFVAMTTAIPSGAIIVATQASIQALVVAGGTSVKVGIGTSIGPDPDKYGLTADLVLNTKSNQLEAPLAALGAGATIRVYACTSGGGIGDTDLSAGSVRVKVLYWTMNDLDDA